MIESKAYAPACRDFARRRFDGECPLARFDLQADPSLATWLSVWLRAEADAQEL